MDQQEEVGSPFFVGSTETKIDFVQPTITKVWYHSLRMLPNLVANLDDMSQQVGRKQVVIFCHWWRLRSLCFCTHTSTLSPHLTTNQSHDRRTGRRSGLWRQGFAPIIIILVVKRWRWCPTLQQSSTYTSNTN